MKQSPYTHQDGNGRYYVDLETGERVYEWEGQWLEFVRPVCFAAFITTLVWWVV